MSTATSLQFTDSPMVLGQYLRALFARGNPSDRSHFPSIEACQPVVRPCAEKIARYADVCGFDCDSRYLPITYPHILAFPLHMELMLHRDFPLPLMGLVHTRNQITQHRRIAATEQLTIRCYIGDSRFPEKGIEFDICTEVRAGNELVWEAVSTNFYRQRTTAKKSSDKKPHSAQRFDYCEQWRLPSDLGRRYARISGDSNPIHLFALSARLFGFKRHIAHGMWSKARIAASLCQSIAKQPCTLTTEFRLPVFLPSTVDLHYSRTETEPAGFRFELRNKRGDKTHVRGEVKPLQASGSE